MNNLQPSLFTNYKEEITNNISQDPSSLNSINYNNNKFLFDSTSTIQKILPKKKQEVNNSFQIAPSRLNYQEPEPTPIPNEKDSINEVVLPCRDTKYSVIPIKKSSTTPLPSYIPWFLGGYYKSLVKGKRNRFEKIKINLGPNAKQDPIYRHKGNYISTTK